MSDCTHETMTNHHARNHPDPAGLFGRFSETVQVWRERQVTRRELARFSDRDIHDAGLSSTDVMYEAAKPFWQA